jgi:hypothetical protein
VKSLFSAPWARSGHIASIKSRICFPQRRSTPFASENPRAKAILAAPAPEGEAPEMRSHFSFFYERGLATLLRTTEGHLDVGGVALIEVLGSATDKRQVPVVTTCVWLEEPKC